MFDLRREVAEEKIALSNDKTRFLNSVYLSIAFNGLA